MKRMIPVFLLLLLHPAASGDEVGDTLRILPYEFESSSGEVVPAELGELQVPENRSVEDSRTITLEFVRFPSTAKEPGPPIVYLAGGPGGSGTGAARGSRFPLFMALREYGDVIAFDQRGTGMSEPDMSCSEQYMLPFDQPIDRTEASARLADAARKCIDRLTASGIDVSAYHTRESAADLDDLRVALGEEKIRLWGISYGTHLALATMKEYGDGIDRVILAGLEGLHHTLKLPSDQQDLLEEIAERVATDRSTKEKVPDLLESIRNLIDQLEEEPRTAMITDPRSGMTIGVTVGSVDLKSALAGMLRGPDSFATMPDFVYRLEGGDWLALALMSAGQRFGPIPPAMGIAMDCASGASSEWRARIERESSETLLGDVINGYMPGICEGVNVPDLGDEFRSPVKSDIPALLISGTLDGRTPVSNGIEVDRHLENAHHLVIEGAGHSDPLFLSTPKILESMKAFLAGESLPYDRVHVVEAIEFVPPRDVVEMNAEQLSRFVADYEIEPGDVRTVIPAGDLLFTRRGGGPLPIRPMSETEFFYEGSATWLRFETDDAGEVTGMTVFHDGSEEGEFAKRMDQSGE